MARRMYWLVAAIPTEELTLLPDDLSHYIRVCAIYIAA